MTEQAAIQLQQLRVGYGSNVILHDLNLDLMPGSWTVVLGPNGSGKTTMLKTLMGQLEPFQGASYIYGKECFKQALPLKRIIGYLPEEMFLYPELTGAQLLCFAGDMHEIPVVKLNERIDYLLDLFGLQDDRNRQLRNYSLGMKRKIGICQALIHEPEVLLLDEPMNGLDPEAADIVRTVLKDYCAQKSMTIFMSTHNMGMLHQYCDDLLIFYKGQFVVKSSPKVLFEEYPGLTLEEIFLSTVKTHRNHCDK